MNPTFTMRSGGTASLALRAAVGVVLVALAIWIPTSAADPTIGYCLDAFTLMAAALSLNLLLGFTGQISIGHSAFFGIGAYVTAIFVHRWGWSPFATMPMAFAISFLVGVLVSLPALRIRGVYLALVTLALGLVFPQILKWQKLQWLTGGTKGIDKAGFNFGKKNRTYSLFGWKPFGDMRANGALPFYFWIGLGIVVIAYLVSRGIVKSRVGRSLVAIRDNETAAAVMGVDIAVTKGLVFGISAGLCALPGCLSAIRTNNVVPDSGFILVLGAIVFLIVMVIGGAGSLWGPIVGAVLYVFIGVKTSDWSKNTSKIPGIIRPFLSWSKIPVGDGIFAVLLIGLMFVAPFGIVGLCKRLAARVVRVVPKPAGAGELHLEPSVDGAVG
jgi:branched-chain amino acid transport system permease protein